jgi:hypothetical protein
MTMYQLPVRAVAAVHVGDPQRDVLVGQVANPCVLSFDHHQNQGVAPGMRLYVLQLGLAVPERAAPGPQLGGSFLVATGRSAVGPQQREAVRMVQEVEVSVYVPCTYAVAASSARRMNSVSSWSVMVVPTRPVCRDEFRPGRGSTLLGRCTTLPGTRHHRGRHDEHTGRPDHRAARPPARR